MAIDYRMGKCDPALLEQKGACLTDKVGNMIDFFFSEELGTSV